MEPSDACTETERGATRWPEAREKERIHDPDTVCGKARRSTTLVEQPGRRSTEAWAEQRKDGLAEVSLARRAHGGVAAAVVRTKTSRTQNAERSFREMAILKP